MSKFGNMVIEVCELREKGFSINDISNKLGISRYDVLKVLEEHYSYVIGES